MATFRELPIPDVVKQSTEATEIVRIWVSEGQQIVTLANQTWSDPAAWGLMLADLARHVIKAYAFDGFDSSEAFARIREGLNAEWDNPTDKAH